MRRILRAWRWLFSCRYVVSYDPADVQWYVDWNQEQPPRYTDTLARTFGADATGAFRSRRKAQRFMEHLHGARYFDSFPILPTRIERIRRKA